MVSIEEKRWRVVGIALNKVLTPVLRDHVKQEMETRYANLGKYCSGLTKPCTLKTLSYEQVISDPTLKRLNFQNVNNNLQMHGKKSQYNYNINSSADLAKLYLRSHQAGFSAFDESLDLTTILLLLEQSDPPICSSARDIREVMIKWCHYRSTDWTQVFFKDCFFKLETLVIKLKLTGSVQKVTLDDLSNWQAKDAATFDVFEAKEQPARKRIKFHVDDAGQSDSGVSNVEAATIDVFEGKEQSARKRIKFHVDDTAGQSDSEGRGLKSGDEWMEVLYRAGTDESPSFDVTNNNEVWLIRNPALYFPLDQDLPRYSTRANPAVRLWKTFISSAPDTLITERHPNLNGIVVVKLKDPVSEKAGAKKLKKALRSMNWTKSTVPPCERGMSQMNFSVLVRAVLEYLQDNHPTTPKEYNFQAELKAASHWYWLKDDDTIQFVSGPFDDIQLKKVAARALRSWTHKLNEMESQAEKFPAKTQGDTEDSDLSCSIEEQISDLDEAVFSLRMYYNMTLEENDDTSSTIMDSPHDSHSSKVKKKKKKKKHKTSVHFVHVVIKSNADTGEDDLPAWKETERVAQGKKDTSPIKGFFGSAQEERFMMTLRARPSIRPSVPVSC